MPFSRFRRRAARIAHLPYLAATLRSSPTAHAEDISRRFTRRLPSDLRRPRAEATPAARKGSSARTLAHNWVAHAFRPSRPTSARCWEPDRGIVEELVVTRRRASQSASILLAHRPRTSRSGLTCAGHDRRGAPGVTAVLRPCGTARADTRARYLVWQTTRASARRAGARCSVRDAAPPARALYSVGAPSVSSGPFTRTRPAHRRAPRAQPMRRGIVRALPDRGGLRRTRVPTSVR